MVTDAGFVNEHLVVWDSLIDVDQRLLNSLIDNFAKAEEEHETEFRRKQNLAQQQQHQEDLQRQQRRQNHHMMPRLKHLLVVQLQRIHLKEEKKKIALFHKRETFYVKRSIYFAQYLFIELILFGKRCRE
ncbi:hypothetical protein C2G38_2310789 [Gigaspora rosea]|uniref:Uncharacterized protein n=1 Tax=Gigaspora rosea TaxID=44941 RepID=A0A397VAD6_9GLOM|nr:hypothetical protein C2G38_2310789 [Gigaspora rosea]